MIEQRHYRPRAAHTALGLLVSQSSARDAVRLYDSFPHHEARLPLLQVEAATACTRVGELARASQLATAARRRLRRRTDAADRVRTTNLLGAIAFGMGHLKTASDEFQDARSGAAAIGDQLTLARACHNIGLIADLTGNVETALAAFDEATASYRSLGHQRGLAETAHNRAIALRLGHRLIEARLSAREAIETASTLGDAALLAQTMFGAADVEISAGDLQAAELLVGSGLGLFLRPDAPLLRAEGARLQAVIALARGQLGRSIELASAARAEAILRGCRQLRGEAAAVLALAHRRAKRSADAKLALAEATTNFAALGATSLAAQLEAARESC